MPQRAVQPLTPCNVPVNLAPTSTAKFWEFSHCKICLLLYFMFLPLPLHAGFAWAQPKCLPVCCSPRWVLWGLTRVLSLLPSPLVWPELQLGQPCLMLPLSEKDKPGVPDLFISAVRWKSFWTLGWILSVWNEKFYINILSGLFLLYFTVQNTEGTTGWIK